MKLLPGQKIVTSDGVIIGQDELFEVLYSEGVKEIQGWTLKDLMEYIAPRGELLGQIAWCNFKAFYEEMQKPVTNQDEWSKKIKWIEIKNISDVDSDGYIREYIDVTGGDEGGERYALGMTPLNYLATLPLKIDETYIVREEFPSDLEMKPYFTGKKEIKLFEIIYGILYEISFYGSPDKREEFNEELESRMTAVTNGEKTYTMEEVKEHIATHMEYNLDSKGPCGAD
jgi:hypothetical protein